MRMNQGLVMMDVAHLDRQSVRAGLRGCDDGRVAIYERYAAAVDMDVGEAYVSEVRRAYDIALYSGAVPGTHLVHAVPFLNASDRGNADRRGAVWVDRMVTHALLAATAIGMAWWTTL